MSIDPRTGKPINSGRVGPPTRQHPDPAMRPAAGDAKPKRDGKGRFTK